MLKPMAIIFLTRVPPESLESQDSALSVTRVFFPKTFKNIKNEWQLNTLPLYCQIPLIEISERARNLKTFFKYTLL